MLKKNNQGEFRKSGSGSEKLYNHPPVLYIQRVIIV